MSDGTPIRALMLYTAIVTLRDQPNVFEVIEGAEFVWFDLLCWIGSSLMGFVVCAAAVQCNKIHAGDE